MIHDIETAPLNVLMRHAAAKRDAVCGRTVSYSRKVFIPLTKLCRDVCHYCTFAERPRAGRTAYLSREAVLSIARAGAALPRREGGTGGTRTRNNNRVLARDVCAGDRGNRTVTARQSRHYDARRN